MTTIQLFNSISASIQRAEAGIITKEESIREIDSYIEIMRNIEKLNKTIDQINNLSGFTYSTIRP